MVDREVDPTIPEVGYVVVPGERLAHLELVASHITTYLQALVEEREWEGFGVAEVRRFRSGRGSQLEELIQIRTMSLGLADRLKAFLSANDVYIPTGACMDQAGEIRLAHGRRMSYSNEEPSRP